MLALVATIVEIQTQALLLSILPIDARLGVALMVDRVCVLVLLRVLAFVVVGRRGGCFLFYALGEGRLLMLLPCSTTMTSRLVTLALA